MVKARITITLDEELLAEVSELADKKERSISQQIVYFVKIGMKKEKESRED